MGRVSDVRERLLKVAVDLIARQSYHAVSVDQICARADVAKGSFYHFFPSKSDLACAAFEEQWKEKQPRLDAIFSPQLPPLERLRQYCAHVFENQQRLREAAEVVCGCPFASLGSELSGQDEQVRARAVERFDRLGRYFESVLRDARAEGLIELDPAEVRDLARAMYSLVLGHLLQGRVRNDLGCVQQLYRDLLRLIGVSRNELTPG